MRSDLFACVLILLAAPSILPAEDAAVAKRFHDFLDEEWEYRLKESPTFASHLGDKRYNDRWPDVSLAAIARRHEHQQEVVHKLDAIARDQLSKTDRLNHLLFRKELVEDVELYPFGWYLVALDQRGGIQTEHELADSLQFKTVKDYEDWITRLQSFPTYVQQTTELMREGVKRHIVQPKIVMRRLPDQIRKQIVEDPAQSLYYKPFKSMATDIGASEQERLKKAAAT